MNETVRAEPIILSAETSFAKERIAKRKTIVYEARVDPNLIEDACKKLKQQLFTKFAFYWFQPKVEDIEFVSLEKYFEPYIVISGKYFIDYLRKRTYVLNIAKGVMEVILRPNKYVPETSNSKRIVKLHGEERLASEAKAFLILDKNGNDSAADNMPPGAQAKNPAKVIKESGIKELAENTDVDFIRERIVKRPKDISEL